MTAHFILFYSVNARPVARPVVSWPLGGNVVVEHVRGVTSMSQLFPLLPPTPCLPSSDFISIYFLILRVVPGQFGHPSVCGFASNQSTQWIRLGCIYTTGLYNQGGRRGRGIARDRQVVYGPNGRGANGSRGENNPNIDSRVDVAAVLQLDCYLEMDRTRSGHMGLSPHSRPHFPPSLSYRAFIFACMRLSWRDGW